MRHKDFRKDRRPAPGRGPSASPARTPGRRPDRAENWLYGLHAVQAALANPDRKSHRVVLTARAAEILGEKLLSRVQVEPADADAISKLLPPGAVHQGVALACDPLPPSDLDRVLGRDAGGRRRIVLVLDQLSDPHNVGAILRTAAAYAVDALVLTDRHAPEFSGVLAKTASGGLEHVPVVQVVNLARAMEELGEMGYQRVGLDSDGAAALEDTPLSKPLALVLGAEGAGLRRLTRENCDVMARLDMPGAIRSLNVSNACAVALSVARGKLRTA